MPRRRPQRIRAGVSRRRTQQTRRVIDGLSPRTLSEISRLEHSRNHLHPGDVSAAVLLWKDYVRRPERELWHDYEWGNVHWYCCGDPFEARALLGTVVQALSPPSARQLRSIINRSDVIWNRLSLPCTVAGG